MKIKTCESYNDSIEMIALFNKFDKESKASWLETAFKGIFSFSFNREIKTPFIYLEKEKTYIFDTCIYRRKDFVFEMKSNRCLIGKDFNFDMKKYEILFDLFVEKFILEWGE